MKTEQRTLVGHDHKLYTAPNMFCL